MSLGRFIAAASLPLNGDIVPNEATRAAFSTQEDPMTNPETIPPVSSPDDAVPEPPAAGPGPIGGDATVAASSWGGASDEEMQELRRAERDREPSEPA